MSWQIPNRPSDGGDKGDNVFNLAKSAAAFAGVVAVFYVVKLLLGH